MDKLSVGDGRIMEHGTRFSPRAFAGRRDPLGGIVDVSGWSGESVSQTYSLLRVKNEQ